MTEVTITVSGDSGAIAYEVYYIAKMLEKKKYTVEIEDKFPPKFDPNSRYGNGKGIKVKLIADHIIDKT